VTEWRWRETCGKEVEIVPPSNARVMKMNVSAPLEWLEIGHKHWKAKAPEGGWYEAFWSRSGWAWRYHLSASYVVLEGECHNEEDCKLACEEHREGNRDGKAMT
jgi:hypothetical protein